MSFYTGIKQIMSSDASLNEYTSNSIYAMSSLEEIKESERSIIVYGYNKDGIEGSLDNPEELSIWSIYIYIGSPRAATVFSISTRLNEYLNRYKDSNFRNIRFISGGREPEFDSENNVYYTDLEFSAIYQGD